MPDISLNKDSKFDVDLAFGNIREERVADIFENKKIEVKTERGIWTRSGNIAIEIEWNGKPSGIMTTQADYWFHILEKDSSDEIASYIHILLNFTPTTRPHVVR